jgi:hypothetical protein
MMNCPGCNAELKPGAGKCLECGYTVSVAPARERKPADWAKLLLGVLKLDEAAVLEVARDPNATLVAVAAIAAGGGAPAIGSFAIFWLIIGPIWMLITSAISIGMVHLIARALGGKGDIQELYRVQGLTYALHLVGVVPFLGPFLIPPMFVAQIALMVNNLRVVYRMPLPAAIGAVILPYVIITVMIGIAVFMFGTAIFALIFASGAAR